MAQTRRHRTRTTGARRAVTPAKTAITEQSAVSAASSNIASIRPLRRGGVANVLVMTAAVGIVGTLAIPAYAFAPGSTDPTFEASAAAQLTKTDAQSVAVDGDVIEATIRTDGYSAVSGEEIRAAQEAEEERLAAEAARAAAEAEMAAYASAYEGPSIGDYLANPPYPSYDLGSVYGVATQYQGVPYVYGGSTPAGFDCSGFVMYVFSQFGIAMPHSVTGQAAMGSVISEADAVPGDLVIMDGHDGFYAGNGMILHAPYEGASVRIQPIWTSSYQIVRIGV